MVMNMSTNEQSKYIFLDGELERQQLIEQIHRVRQEVIEFVDRIPESEWYEPRYHGWSLAAMIAHLNAMDNICMLLIKMALIGIKFPLGRGALNSSNSAMAQLFQKRILSSSMKSLPKNEERISKFILGLPLNRLSREVFQPNLQKYLTIEQALQSFFLHHWEEHLQTLRIAEGLQSAQSRE